MKRCKHSWQPLIPRPIVVAKENELAVAFALQLQRLDHYDRCSKCGRISWITKTRNRNRNLMLDDFVAGVQRRADEFLDWVETMKSPPLFTTTRRSP